MPCGVSTSRQSFFLTPPSSSLVFKSSSAAGTDRAILELNVKGPVDDPRFERNRIVYNNPKICFYAGAAITTPRGVPIGAVWVVDDQPRELYDWQRSVLVHLSRQVTTQLELRLKTQKVEDEVRSRCAGSPVFSPPLRFLFFLGPCFSPWPSPAITLLCSSSSSRQTRATPPLAPCPSAHQAKSRLDTTVRKLAMSADHLKSAFVARVSHELRAPLHGITSALALVAETEPLSDEQLELLVRSRVGLGWAEEARRPGCGGGGEVKKRHGQLAPRSAGDGGAACAAQLLPPPPRFAAAAPS